MKFKVLIIILAVFFVSGCDVNYNLIIKENTFQEETDIVSENNEVYQNQNLTNFLKTFTSSFIPSYYNPDNYDLENGEYQYGIEYYTITERLNGIKVGYTYNATDFYRSRVVKEGFDEISIQKSDDTYSITTNGGCKAFKNYKLLDNLTVQLQTEYKVIYSNADEEMNGRYLWYFSKDNYDRNIKVIFKTSKEDFSDFDATDIPDQADDSSNQTWINEHKTLVIVIAMVCFFGIIFTLIIYQRHSKNKN